MAKFKTREPNHMLAAEMSDDPETYDEADHQPTPEPEPVAEPVAVVEAAPVAPVAAPVAGLDPNTATILSALVQAIQGGNQALVDSLMQQSQMQVDSLEKVARQKMPENARDPEISVYNPWGDRDYPRPVLQGKVYIAQKNPQTGFIERLFEEEPEMLTFDELLCLNALPSMGPTDVELTDGEVVKVSVELLTTGEGKSQRVEQRLIVIPYGLLSKDNKANKNRWVGPRVARLLLGPERAAAVLDAGRPKVEVAA